MKRPLARCVFFFFPREAISLLAVLPQAHREPAVFPSSSPSRHAKLGKAKVAEVRDVSPFSARLYMHEAGSGIEICPRHAFQSRSPVSCRAEHEGGHLAEAQRKHDDPHEQFYGLQKTRRYGKQATANMAERRRKKKKMGCGGDLIISANFMENFTSVHCGSLITTIALVSCHLQINSRRWWDFFFSFSPSARSRSSFRSLCFSHVFMRQNLKV